MAEVNTEETEITVKNEKKQNKKNKKELTPGIIYLSRIPTMMNVKKLRDILSTYGEIGRIFLQPDEKSSHKKKKNRTFSEGWVEYADKKIAKVVASRLNTQIIGGKRHNPWFEELWNMKYLPKFKWAHLNERLAYEKAVHKQRMRTEIAQAKREANFYIQNVEKKKHLQKKGKKQLNDTREWTFNQKETEEEKLSKKRSLEESTASVKKAKFVDNRKAGKDMDFLKSLFSGGVKEAEAS